MVQTNPSSEQSATFHLEDLHCTGCAAAVEHTLRAQPAITHVHLDWAHDRVHVGYFRRAYDSICP